MNVRFVTACGAEQVLLLPFENVRELPKFWSLPLSREPEPISDGEDVPTSVIQYRKFELSPTRMSAAYPVYREICYG